MKPAPALLVLCLIAGLTSCASETRQADGPDDTLLPASCGAVSPLHLAGDVYLAGQPSAEDFQRLKDRGVKTVINLRMPGETDLDEQQLVEALGLAYVHIPWSGAEMLTDARLDAMRAALRDSARPVVLHCASSNRVGAGWLAYRVLDQGLPVEHALAEAKTAGMRTPAYETITLDYIARQTGP